MVFDITNLQFVIEGESRGFQLLPGKTQRNVCCDRTKRCLELLVPYHPNEKEFLFFEHTFSKPHIFRKIGTVPQIAVKPEILDRFFKMVEKKALEISRTNLREAFFKCLEIDLTLDIHRTTTGIASYPILKFIDRLEEAKAAALAEPSTEILEPGHTPPNSDFTTARQVLAIHYLLEYNQVRGVDQTQKAKFIEFLTGKNYKNIYDLVRNPLATKTGGFRKNDLRYIRTFFDNLEMRGIVQMIDNELDKPDL